MAHVLEINTGTTAKLDTLTTANGLSHVLIRETDSAKRLRLFDGTTLGGVPLAFLAGDLAALEALSTTGIAARTGASTWATRTLTGTSNRLSVSNGDGVAGNPTLDISASYVGQASITTLGTIGTGTWQATKIGLAYGGTNADLSATGGTSQVLKQASAGAAITVGQLGITDLSGLGTGVATFLGTPSSANLVSALTDSSATLNALATASGAMVLPLSGTGQLSLTGVTTNAAANFGSTTTSTSTTSATSVNFNGQLNAAGASLNNWQYMNLNGQTGSTVNSAIVNAQTLRVGFQLNSGFAGTITNGVGITVNGPAFISGTLQTLLPAWTSITTAGSSNGTGITSGSSSNTAIQLGGHSAVAGAGGTIANTGAKIFLSTGVNAGTTTNRALWITGNGQTGGATNYAIYSDSTAPSLISGNLSLASTISLDWNSDTFQFRGAAGRIDQRNSTNAQGRRIYNTYTDASNGEWGYDGSWLPTANVLTYGTDKNGTGGARNIQFLVGGTKVADYGIISANQFTFTTPTIVVNSGNSVSAWWKDITPTKAAAVGLNNPSATTGNDLTFSTFTGSSWVTGIIMPNNTSNILFGGSTSSFAGLLMSGTTIQAKLADNSAFSPIKGKLTTDTNYTASATTPTGYMVLYDATGTAYEVPAKLH